MIIRPNTHQQFTVIVGGTEFSGTSLVAGALRILGIPMGERFSQEDTHQDIDFCQHEFTPALRNAIGVRNSQYPVWGLKWVDLQAWLDEALPYLRNPVFIYCHRDIGAVLRRDDKRYGRETISEFADHIRESYFLADFLQRNQIPLLLAEFGEPKSRLFRDLAQFTHAELDEDTLNDLYTFSSGSYRAL